MDGNGGQVTLESGRPYHLSLSVLGQRARLAVDGVEVIDTLLPEPLQGASIGLLAVGNARAQWGSFLISRQQPKIFVIMQFGTSYDALYSEVIKEVGERAGCDIIRVDEQLGPGLIIDDVQRLIQEARVVIAEVTPHNPNVFYEVGYAHALGKPTILLASDTKQLPFDIRGYRVVVHEDSIAGKRKIEDALRTFIRCAQTFVSTAESLKCLSSNRV